MLGLSCNDYRVATLSKLYLTGIEIILQSLKSIGQFIRTDGRTDELTNHNYRKSKPFQKG